MDKQIKLATPIKIDGVEVKVLTMRKPKVRDMLAVDNIPGQAKKEITLMANLCEVTTTDIEDLDMDDYEQLQETYQSFLSSKSGT